MSLHSSTFDMPDQRVRQKHPSVFGLPVIQIFPSELSRSRTSEEGVSWERCYSAFFRTAARARSHSSTSATS